MNRLLGVILILLAFALENVDAYAGGSTMARPNVVVKPAMTTTVDVKNSNSNKSVNKGVRGGSISGNSSPVLSGGINQKLSEPLSVFSDSTASFTPQTGSMNDNNNAAAAAAGMFEMMNTDSIAVAVDRSVAGTPVFDAVYSITENEVNNNGNSGYAYNSGSNQYQYQQQQSSNNKDEYSTSAVFGAGAFTGAIVMGSVATAVFLSRKAFVGGAATAVFLTGKASKDNNISSTSNKKKSFKEAYAAARNIKNNRLSTPLMATTIKDDAKSEIDFIPIELPELPWKRDALVPHISEETINYHYDKHHAGYVTKLNAALPGTEYENLSLDEIIEKAGISTTGIANNAHQIWNHNFYWQSMAPNAGGLPSTTGKLHDAINKSFGSFDNFKKEFSTVAGGHFGSGWAWLISDPDGNLSIVDTHDAGTPRYHTYTNHKVRLFPLLTCDVWEHAYYIDYRNARPDYIEAWWNLVNWEFAEDNYEKAITDPLYH